MPRNTALPQKLKTQRQSIVNRYHRKAQIKSCISSIWEKVLTGVFGVYRQAVDL